VQHFELGLLLLKGHTDQLNTRKLGHGALHSALNGHKERFCSRRLAPKLIVLQYSPRLLD